MKAVLALFAILAVATVANAATSGFIGFSAYTGTSTAACGIPAALVGGSGGAVASYCKAVGSVYTGYACAADNSTLVLTNCTNAQCTTGCTSTAVPLCQANSGAYLLTKCYATLEAIPTAALATNNYKINTFASSTCAAPAVQFLFAPTGVCIPNPNNQTTSLVNSCNATGVYIRHFSTPYTSSCPAANLVGTDFISATCANNIEGQCLINGTFPTGAPTAAPTAPPTTTGNTSSAIAISASALIVFIASVLVAAF